MALELEGLLKRLYPATKIYDLAQREKPFFAMVPKNEKFVGEAAAVPVHYGNTNKRSATFSAASGHSGTAKTNKFLITRVKDYALATMDRETLKASESDEGAFVSYLKFAMDDAIAAVSQSTALALYRNGSGQLGRISATSNISSDTISFTNVSDVANVQAGQILVLSATDGTGSVKSGTLTVESVDPIAGTVTFTVAVDSGVASAAVNDYVFMEGDYGIKISGLDAWLPSSAPTSGDSFFGLNRSVDAVRLAGVRFSPTGASITEDILGCVSQVGAFGGSPDTCFLPFSKWLQLEVEQNNSVMYVDVSSGQLEIPFKAIMVKGPRGMIKCVPDAHCPENRIYVLQMNTWKLHSLGAAPHIFEDDGKIIREQSLDAYTARIGLYAQLACNAPGYNGVILYS